MHIVLEAKSINGVVERADDINHLTNGIRDSEGIILIEGNIAIYIPNDTNDKKDTLFNLVSIVDDLKEICNSLVNAFNSVGTVISTTPVAPGSPINPSFNAHMTLQSKINNLTKKLNDIKQACNYLKQNLS